MGATQSAAGFARTSPEGGCFEQGGGLDEAGVLVCELLFVCVCVCVKQS